MTFFRIFFIIVYLNIFFEYSTSKELGPANTFYYLSYYSGEKFPTKYLKPEKVLPSIPDLYNYVNSLTKIVAYFTNRANASNDDANAVFGMYLSKGILKRTLADYGDKLKKLNLEGIIKANINGADYVVSHYVYAHNNHNWYDHNYRLAKLFQSDAELIYSIKNFRRDQLMKWILSNVAVHNHVEQMDEATYPREEYVKLCIARNNTFINTQSDECITKIVFNSLPIILGELTPCRKERVCDKAALSSPSYAYVLSHRLLILLTRQIFRRCYTLSEELDNMFIDVMCSNMYREAVYLARRGYFARDIFAEHIALCSTLGYEEFFRPTWYLKMASWIDGEGCFAESYNFEFNRTSMGLRYANNPNRLKTLKKFYLIHKLEDCHTHPMTLVAVNMAHAIRYAIHHFK